MLDTLVTGGRVVTPEGVREVSVGIVGERIEGVYPPGSEPEARERIDASGLTVLPGLIDVHATTARRASSTRRT